MDRKVKILYPLWLEEETLNHYQLLARADGLSTPVLMQQLLKKFLEKQMIENEPLRESPRCGEITGET